MLRFLAPIAFALVLCGCPPPEPRLPDNVRVVKNLVYGFGYVEQAAPPGTYVLRELLFDLIEPTDDSSAFRPALVLLHGGGFESGSKSQLKLVEFAGQIAGQGFVCFLIDYRLRGDGPPEPPRKATLEAAAHAAFVDTKVALRHVRAYAAVYGIDRNRIAVFGESAGAFAALAAGVTDPEDFASDGPDFPVPFDNLPDVDPRPNAVVDFWGSAAPVLNAFDPGDPPILIVHGTRDRQPETPFREAQRIANACAANGIPFELVPLPRADHGAWDARVNGQDLATLTRTFLRNAM